MRKLIDRVRGWIYRQLHHAPVIWARCGLGCREDALLGAAVEEPVQDFYASLARGRFRCIGCKNYCYTCAGPTIKAV